MGYYISLHFARSEEKIAVEKTVFWSTLAATPNLCTFGVTPTVNLNCWKNLERVQIQEESWVPFWEFLNTLPSYQLQIFNSSICHKQHLELMS